MNEDFEDLKGYEGLYRINRNGDIFSVISNRVLKPNITHGYKRLGLCKDKQRIQHVVHRLLAIQYLDNPENKRCVDHIDRNKQNNCLGNLRWATDSENQHNRGVKGNIYITKYNRIRVAYCYEPRKYMTKSFKTQAEAEEYLEELKKKYPR